MRSLPFQRDGIDPFTGYRMQQQQPQTEPASATWYAGPAALLSAPSPYKDGIKKRDEHAEEIGEQSEIEDDDRELIMTSLHMNVQAAAYVLTVRGLRDRRWGTMLMAWLWVLISLAITAFFMYVSYDYVAFTKQQKFDPDAAGSRIQLATIRLTQAVHGNLTLTADEDREIIHLCNKLPSPYFFCVVEFVFNAYLMSQLSECRTLMVQIFTCPVVRRRTLTAEDHDDSMVITGLLRGDALWLIGFLIVPKMILTAVMWYIGTAVLAFTQAMMHMIARILILILMSQVDHVIFHSFFSSSKKEWVKKTHVVQYRGRCVRYGTAWPGELAKLFAVVAWVGLSYLLFADEFSVRTLCWECARDCSSKCSSAFHYCEATSPRMWPWLHDNVT